MKHMKQSIRENVKYIVIKQKKIGNKWIER